MNEKRSDDPKEIQVRNVEGGGRETDLPRRIVVVFFLSFFSFYLSSAVEFFYTTEYFVHIALIFAVRT